MKKRVRKVKKTYKKRLRKNSASLYQEIYDALGSDAFEIDKVNEYLKKQGKKPLTGDKFVPYLEYVATLMTGDTVITGSQEFNTTKEEPDEDEDDFFNTQFSNLGDDPEPSDQATVDTEPDFSDIDFDLDIQPETPEPEKPKTRKRTTKASTKKTTQRRTTKQTQSATLDDNTNTQTSGFGIGDQTNTQASGFGIGDNVSFSDTLSQSGPSLTSQVEDQFDNTRRDQLSAIFNESLQKVEFYKNQTGRSGSYLKNFAEFIQFLPTTKSEGFRTEPPPVGAFSKFVSDAIESGRFEQLFGKQANVQGIGWKYLTSQFGTPIGSSRSKPAGIGTIIVYVRSNGHTQLYIPSISPVERNNKTFWSPSAEFVSRPKIAFWSSDSENIKKQLNQTTGKGADLIEEITEIYNSRKFLSYPQMLRFVQKWRTLKPMSIQKRSVMPVFVFKEVNGFPVFHKAFRGLTAKVGVNIQTMLAEGDRYGEGDQADFSGDNLDSDLRRLIQIMGQQMQNNPAFQQRIHKRVKKRKR